MTSTMAAVQLKEEVRQNVFLVIHFKLDPFFFDLCLSTNFSTTSYSSLTRKIVLFALFAHLDAHYTKKCRPYTGSFGQFLTDCLESESTLKK